MEDNLHLGKRWLLLAVVYFVLGVTLGVYMGGTQKFVLAPVHAHINLLGWVSLTLTGFLYMRFPKAGAHVLAKVHFWLYNLTLPIMLGLLVLHLTGTTSIDPMLGLTSGLVWLSVVIFAVNIFRNH